MSADRAGKQFDATPARRQKAKREGNAARSSEVATIAAFACAAGVTVFAVPLLGTAAAVMLRAAAQKPDAAAASARLGLLIAVSLAPAAAAAIGGASAGVLQAGGLRFRLPAAQFGRLNPVAGLKRMAGGEAIVGALRAIAAFSAVTAALMPTLCELFARSTTLGGAASFAALAFAGIVHACWAAIAAGACFAAADYALVRRRWLRDLKMTREDLRRDQKENDGDPHARSRRKSLHRAFAKGSIARTKEASFVVVNPTHIAIAIRYAPPNVPVPEIVVRAVDDGALSVKELARRHGIPIVENVALARALYAQGEAGRAIPSETFIAVARVIAELIRAGVLT